MSDPASGFFNAFLSVAAIASVNGLPMLVWLKGGQELRGIPAMGEHDLSVEYGWVVTIGDTSIIAHEVEAFGLALT